MLTLTRKVGESIYVGKDVMIVVKEIKGKQVRIGIEAPMELPVYRGELYERIMEENRVSAGANVSMNELSTLFKNVQKGK